MRRHGQRQRTDELTGLLNRKYFYEILDEEYEKNKDGSLALILFNIDDFKLYNQLYGNQQGRYCTPKGGRYHPGKCGENRDMWHGIVPRNLRS